MSLVLLIPPENQLRHQQHQLPRHLPLPLQGQPLLLLALICLVLPLLHHLHLQIFWQVLLQKMPLHLHTVHQPLVQPMANLSQPHHQTKPLLVNLLNPLHHIHPSLTMYPIHVLVLHSSVL